MEEKRKGKKKKKEKIKKKEKKTTYSLPSLRERSETPGALDRHNWESQETPVAQNRLQPTLLVTGILAVGWVVENQFCTGGRTRDSIIGEATFRSQSVSE